MTKPKCNIPLFSKFCNFDLAILCIILLWHLVNIAPLELTVIFSADAAEHQVEIWKLFFFFFCENSWRILLSVNAKHTISNLKTKHKQAPTTSITARTLPQLSPFARPMPAAVISNLLGQTLYFLEIFPAVHRGFLILFSPQLHYYLAIQKLETSFCLGAIASSSRICYLF